MTLKILKVSKVLTLLTVLRGTSYLHF